MNTKPIDEIKVDILSTLTSLPKIIYDLMQELDLLKIKIEGSDLTLDLYERQVRQLVEDDTRYSNESKRKTAIKLILEEDEEYKTERKLNSSLNANILVFKTKLVFATNQLGAAKASAALLASM
jgi:hypothetical protein